jgi:hypothetical protein
MSNDNDKARRPAASGPTIGQALIWGFMAAAFGSLFAFIGKQLSDAPSVPPATDALHGASDPAEMNRIVDNILAAATPALGHDRFLVMKLGIAIIVLCALIVVATLWIIRRRHLAPHTPVHVPRTVFLILILAVPVTAITVGASAMQDRLLESSGISESLRNQNTDPPVVRVGSPVTITMPVSLQSFFAYYECKSFTITSATATLPSGETISVALTNAKIDNGGSKPGTTDVIPTMENVKVYLNCVVPNDSRLGGAVVELSVAGSLRLIPSTSHDPIESGDFDTTVNFRVARDKEAGFQTSYDSLSLGRYNWFSFPAAAFAIIGIVLFSPWTCRQCRGRVSAFKIMDGHLCPTCFKERKKK